MLGASLLVQFESRIRLQRNAPGLLLEKKGICVVFKALNLWLFVSVRKQVLRLNTLKNYESGPENLKNTLLDHVAQ